MEILVMAIKRQTVNFRKNFFEKIAWDKQKVVCGIDEVGRGCLAGPLVTAAVILPVNKTSQLLKDSKLLNEPERLKANKWIVKHCWYGFGIVHNRLVDQHNIWQATLIAMKKALVNLLASCFHLPDAILIDAMPLNLFDTSYKTIPVHYFSQGERKSSSIAAASIIAKVRRDDIMRRFDSVFPGYKFACHKGYGTKKHRAAVKELNYSLIHRVNFLRKILSKQDNSDEKQQSLC